MTKLNYGVSSEAVYKATGKHWNEWIQLLNAAGADKWLHKDIAKWLREEGYIKSGWWCQSVTVGYEYSIGRRVVGETSDAGFEIGVQRTFDMDSKSAWDMMVSPEALRIWLGTTKVDFKKGEKFTTPLVSVGEIRTIDHGNRLRLRWQAEGWDNMTTLQMTLLPKSEKTSIHFHQEKLKNTEQRKAMKLHWESVLKKLKEG